MSNTWHIAIHDETSMRLLAELLAAKVMAGDTITLKGDLGAGKTTFARYLIRALLGDDEAEVPSPTYALVQDYETPRFEVRHFDLYRISGGDELGELAFDDGQDASLTIVEWPERAEGRLPARRFDMVIGEGLERTDAKGDGDKRSVTITSTREVADRLDRIQAQWDFCHAVFDAKELPGVRLAFLQGDASPRGYVRVTGGPRRLLLMDMPRMPDGPVLRDGKTYSAIAHLAEDARPFIAIAEALRTVGVSAPKVDAFDEVQGLALIEDLGRLTFAEAMAAGIPQQELWHAAVDLLVALRRHPAPVFAEGLGVSHALPLYGADVLQAEVALLADWYWPHKRGRTITDAERMRFEALWAPYVQMVSQGGGTAGRPAWVLRDFHSPNLLWLPERQGLARVGVIDFQDAQAGHAAYDLVSLALDARVDVPQSLYEALINDYCRQVAIDMPTFDEAIFRRDVAILGAQRNTKILGIFARLSMRDGKHSYLSHIPRITSYLRRCLEHPALADLRVWYNEVLRLDEGLG